MKKLIVLFVSIFLLFSIYGCASEYIDDPDPGLSNVLRFDSNQLIFYVQSGLDVLYGIPNPSDDVIILKTVYFEESLSEDQQNAYRHILEHIETLSEETSVSISDILQYDSQTLNDALEALQLDVTLNDIVIFNELKTLSEDWNMIPVMTRFEYIEARLQRTLTMDEESNINYLQYLYIDLRDIDDNYRLFDHTDLFLIETLESYGIRLADDNKDAITNAYELLLQLN